MALGQRPLVEGDNYTHLLLLALAPIGPGSQLGHFGPEHVLECHHLASQKEELGDRIVDGCNSLTAYCISCADVDNDGFSLSPV